VSRDIPGRGDILHLGLDPTLGCELKKMRPVLVLCADEFNRKYGHPTFLARHFSTAGFVCPDSTLQTWTPDVCALQIWTPHVCAYCVVPDRIFDRVAGVTGSENREGADPLADGTTSSCFGAVTSNSWHRVLLNCRTAGYVSTAPQSDD
jgi:hypothetical protein